ncbi:hypothetical protein [Geoalkalibacter halelectricus]|uniref:PepSY domain-containing protein n=1 Tax=Geoalkalibacter halelectricus TaxID=2847045 RepID=A0ABY5ZL80_9BACT|nr:hypothetical protein [Geoalkalibacter halelectricus]MDO3377212.1 hypothetical protein [Geoalkalibacter halelectricus]UWZ79343.1 hypothetical protein L9S41_16925 [Geoalkalibacter halelectricus]
MDQRQLRRWHYRVGLLLAPFLLLQAFSGLVLTYGVFSPVDTALAEEAPEVVRTAWNLLMLRLHYGPGLIGWIYHSVIGLGMIWLVLSGVWIWFDRKRKMRQARREG